MALSYLQEAQINAGTFRDGARTERGSKTGIAVATPTDRNDETGSGQSMSDYRYNKLHE